MKYVIYQRVSTSKQCLERQEYAIDEYCNANGIIVSEENRYSDKITGKTFRRDNYLQMKASLEKGDCLIILDLDRLGRNWDLIKQEWQWFLDNQINIIVVNMPLLNSNPSADGKVSIDRRLIQGIVFDLMCYLSQKEVEKISQRTKEALLAKKMSGVALGRRKDDRHEEQVETIRKCLKNGLSAQEIYSRRDEFGISYGRTTIYDIVKGLGDEQK